MLDALGAETTRLLRSAREAGRRDPDEGRGARDAAPRGGAAPRPSASGRGRRAARRAPRRPKRAPPPSWAKPRRVPPSSHAETEAYAEEQRPTRRARGRRAHRVGAHQQGREMLDEAKATRERVLADLARRRSLLQAQIEALRAGRDSLLDAYRVVKRSFLEATGALLASRGTRGRRARRARERTRTTAEHSDDLLDPITRLGGEGIDRADIDCERHRRRRGRRGHGRRGRKPTPQSEEARPTRPTRPRRRRLAVRPHPRRSDRGHGRRRRRRRRPRRAGAGAQPDRSRRRSRPSHGSLRRRGLDNRAQAGSVRRRGTRPSPGRPDARPTRSGGDPDGPRSSTRSSSRWPSGPSAPRRTTRTRLLDAVRRHKGRPTAAQVLVPEPDLLTAWTAVVRDALDEAYGAGRVAVGGEAAGADDALVREAAETIVLPLRERIVVRDRHRRRRRYRWSRRAHRRPLP